MNDNIRAVEDAGPGVNNADREFVDELHHRRVAEVRKATPARFANAEAPDEVAAWAQAYVESRDPSSRELTSSWSRPAAGDPVGNLVIVGPTGVGKTSACWAALRLLVEGGFAGSWRFWNAADLAAQLRPSDESEHVIDTARKTALLIIDDLAVSGITEWQMMQLTRIVDVRWQNLLPTVITSNIRNLRSVLDDRMASRLQDGAMIVTMRGTDRRRP